MQAANRYGLTLADAMAHMKRGTILIAVLAWQGFAACGRSDPEMPGPQHSAEQTIETPAGARLEVDSGAALIGNWELRSDPPQPMPGFRLTVTVDSATETGYFGRLTNYFSGNVGIDPRQYAAFVDSIRPDGSVTFAMPAIDRTMLGITLQGTLAADTIQLDTFVLGPDTLSGGTRRWALVKRP